MMNVTFHNFSKRTNSTKQVSTEVTTLSCELKDNVNIFNPVLRIKNMPNLNTPMWNYCYIQPFQRYYFVNNWRWVNAVWECDLVCDVLASFKTSIGAMSEYIMRSSAESDGKIEDTAYIAKAEVTTDMTLLPEFYIRSMTAGFYVVGIIGKESTATQGAITYYQMTPDEIARLRAYLLSDTFLTDQGLVNLADFVPADATKVIYNPYQYIVSCMWFPFAASAIDSAYKDAVTSIDFGWWNTGTGFSAYRIKANAPIYSREEDISITSHPQIARGDYLNHAPYTSRVLRMVPFGEIQLPDQYLDATDHIRMQLQCDFITGIGYLNLYAQTSNNQGRMLMTRMCQKLGVDIQLAQVGSDYLGARTVDLQDRAAFISDAGSALNQIDVSSYGSAAATALSAGVQLGMASSVYEVASMNNYLKAKAPQLLTDGTNGSRAAYTQNNYLCTTFYILVDDDNPQLGRPLCKIRTISAIPGYILVRNPDVQLACFEIERTLITQFMANGFFYE